MDLRTSRKERRNHGLPARAARERVINPITGRSILHGDSTHKTVSRRVLSGETSLPRGHEIKEGLLIRSDNAVSSYSFKASLALYDGDGNRVKTNSGKFQAEFPQTITITLPANVNPDSLGFEIELIRLFNAKLETMTVKSYRNLSIRCEYIQDDSGTFVDFNDSIELSKMRLYGSSLRYMWDGSNKDTRECMFDGTKIRRQ
jgi:hypothetical protein